MRTTDSIETDWQALISRLSQSIDLDATARETGALVRRRCVADAATLLRLALAYGPGGMSLRSAAAWAGMNDVASLSDVALLKRLRGAADWLGDIAGALVEEASVGYSLTQARRLRIVDGSSISRPGSAGTDWRIHATYEPALARFTHLEISDAHGGEAFSRVPLREGDLVLGDRAYARAPSLEKVVSAGADFIVRTGWTSVRLTTLDGELVDWSAIYEPMQPDEVREIDVLAEHSGRKLKGRGKPLFQARLIVKRKDAQAAEKSEKAARRSHQRRRYTQTMQPMTITAAGFVMLLTSIPAKEMSADEVLETYRLRWQVELAFKRLKSGLGIHKLPARDERLSRSWLTAHLIVALMIDEAVTDVLDSPPCEDETVLDQTPVDVAAA
ncbi:IS4 family transposase [Mesorhizobium sp.]|uniref:IS4 family transposase n=1 Tax=Mesorhizobium sp. TaxID=1871066 RepID=UPI0011FD0A32|nr:IS4 family transposase [Mesorhizobium sp.]TIP09218.1 MAG: IS4 family transposase [Mesorhizobium sp.]